MNELLIKDTHGNTHITMCCMSRFIKTWQMIQKVLNGLKKFKIMIEICQVVWHQTDGRDETNR